MLRSASQKIIPIFYKSSLSLSDPEEIIVRVRILRKKRKKKNERYEEEYEQKERER